MDRSRRLRKLRVSLADCAGKRWGRRARLGRRYLWSAPLWLKEIGEGRTPCEPCTLGRLRPLSLLSWRAALIGLGANLGDRQTTLDRAIELLAADSQIDQKGLQPLKLETTPVGSPADPGGLSERMRRSWRLLLAPVGFARSFATDRTATGPTSPKCIGVRARWTSTCFCTMSKWSMIRVCWSHTLAWLFGALH